MGRALVGLAALVVFSSMAVPAEAVPDLATPWPCGQTYRVTQGHNTGSHTGKGGWAWDFGIGVGGEVAAPADGVIRLVRDDSTSYGCGSAYANDANYVVLDFQDGTEALFLHLKANSARVSPGQHVSRGDVLAEVGNSGWICGTHLHFQIQNNCSSWWCQSIQASFLDYGDPVYNTSVASNNCGPPPICSVPAGQERIIDETEDCFRRVTDYWWDHSGGWADHWYHTFAISGNADTVGSWHFEVEQAGDYEVDVHIPAGAQSRQAKYYVSDGAATHGPIQLDQTAATGWRNLGRYTFQTGQELFVRLPDNTGESYDDRRQLAFDAIRVRPYTPPPPEDTGVADAGPADTGSPVPDIGEADAGTEDVSGPDIGSQDSGAGDDVGSVDAAHYVDVAEGKDTSTRGAGGFQGQGEACSVLAVGSPASTAPWFALVFVLLGWRGRRHQ